MSITKLIPSQPTGAVFNQNRTHRLSLWRVWNHRTPLVAFVALNPSRANESYNDPTIRKCITIARRHGYGGMFMLNLYTFITPYPDKLEYNNTTGDVQMSDAYISSAREQNIPLIFCWGNFPDKFPVVAERAAAVIEMFPEAYCLGTTKSGNPKHPCRLANNTKIIPYAR